ncbi:hypothetical protein GCM10027598_56040 [Amycolatopsis oliviviridis]|uniref:Secreted protein n=1 Tax=Amycolatopsis oliviviridis TaxID=1471590 RepID=A0ABQ3LVL9_9PSEU|nr:hypothetical protein GCM10017790_56690 [Amycolatopsis oliviviridis]
MAAGWATVTAVITAAAAKAPDTTRLTGCDCTAARVSFAVGHRLETRDEEVGGPLPRSRVADREARAVPRVPASRLAECYRNRFGAWLVPVQLPDKAASVAIPCRRLATTSGHEISDRLRNHGHRVHHAHRKNSQ